MFLLWLCLRLTISYINLKIILNKTTMTLKNLNKNFTLCKKRVESFLMNKKWKGGRLKTRFNTRVQVKGYLTDSSSCFVFDSQKTGWLSSMTVPKRNLRGNELLLNYSRLLLIDKRSN